MFRFLRSKLGSGSLQKIDVVATVAFFVLFVMVVVWEETRKSASIDILFGAFTTNVPGLVVVFYIAAMVFLGRHRISWQGGKFEYRSRSFRQLEQQNDTGISEFEVSEDGDEDR